VPADICVFPNSASDPLGCFASAVRHFDPRAVVRIPVGNPFLDPVLIDRLIASAVSHPGVDYVSYCRSDGRPVVLSQFGLVAEWCAAAAVEQAEREATDPLDRQNPTRYIYGHPERFALRLIAVPSPLDRTDVRLAVSREEDWEHAQAILEALGPESLDWQRIAQLLDQQPTMRARMEDLNQAEAR
jgi:spore coat polysaccharide biosynthesis protein SpsF